MLHGAGNLYHVKDCRLKWLNVLSCVSYLLMWNTYTSPHLTTCWLCSFMHVVNKSICYVKVTKQSWQYIRESITQFQPKFHLAVQLSLAVLKFSFRTTRLERCSNAEGQSVVSQGQNLLTAVQLQVWLPSRVFSCCSVSGPRTLPHVGSQSVNSNQPSLNHWSACCTNWDTAAPNILEKVPSKNI